MNELVHLSDWSSQPEIRISCTKKHHFPWTIRKDLPPEVYEVPQNNAPSILYTFNVRLVTCPDCRKLHTFKEGLRQAQEYDRSRAESGLTEAEYVAKLIGSDDEEDHQRN